MSFASAVAGSRYDTYATAADGTETRERPAPDDLCYVHGFDEPDRPAALRLERGRSLVVSRASLPATGEWLRTPDELVLLVP